MGGPGFLEKAQKSIKLFVFSWLLLSGLVLIGVWWALNTWMVEKPIITLGILVGSWLVLSLIIGMYVANQVTKIK
jgi:hypothetical protein